MSTSNTGPAGLRLSSSQSVPSRRRPGPSVGPVSRPTPEFHSNLVSLRVPDAWERMALGQWNDRFLRRHAKARDGEPRGQAAAFDGMAGKF